MVLRVTRSDAQAARTHRLRAVAMRTMRVSTLLLVLLRLRSEINMKFALLN